MKKHLLFDFTKSLGCKISFRMAAFTALILLVAQSSFAQTATYTWTGTTSSDFLTGTNWNAVPLYVNTEAFIIGVTGNNGDQITNSAPVAFRTIALGTGVTFNTGANITGTTNTSSINGTLNINVGTANLPKLYTGTVAGVSGVVNVEAGTTLTGNNVWRVADNLTATGTININGGTLTLGTSGSMSLGHQNTGTLNINSGVVNINYTLFSSFVINDGKGHVNIDGGSIVIPGDQTAAVQAFIDASKISVSGAALAAGKTISNTYDSGTNKTTVIAGAPLGINDVKQDANSIVVYAQNQNIKIQSVNGTLSDVKVYDLNGRLVAGKKSIGANETSIPLDDSNGVYVVKVTTANGAVVTKKIVQ